MHTPPRPVLLRAKKRLALLLAVATTLVFLPLGLAPLTASAGGSPGGAVATAWPATWNLYRYKDGTKISDVNSDQTPPTFDLASGACVSCAGPESSVQYAADGTTAFFRMRLADDIADASKGGLVGGAFLTQIAVNDVVAAVVGVDGKSSSMDQVYVADSVGGTVTPVYTYPFDNSGGQSSAGMRVVPAGDGTGQYFLDYQVPLSVLATVSGGRVTPSTPIKLYYGSSAAANLATINKDFMAGNVSAADFSNLSTISFSAAALALSSSATPVSGPNPPGPGQSSSYAVTVTAKNSGGGDLTGASVTIPAPAGVAVSSPSTATGSLSGSPLVWTIGTLYPGASVTATFTAALTPAGSDEGSRLQLVGQQSGSATDPTTAASRTATGPEITVGPVAQAPRFTVTFDSNGGSAVADQAVASGGKVTKPADPTRAGYRFGGWYTATTGDTQWNFADDTVTGDRTLHARWVAPVAVTSTTTRAVRPNTTTNLEGLSVAADDEAATLQVIVSANLGTLSMTAHDNLGLDYGNNWSGDASISFQGGESDVNAALSSVQLTTGAETGKTARVSVTALPTQPGFVYSPSNGHFYQYVADPGISWTDAAASAKSDTFLGQSGYLATMPTAQTNDLVANRVQGAQNVWFGAESTDTFDFSAEVKRTWAWSAGPLAGRPISYCSNVDGVCDFVNNDGLYSGWQTGEPNNANVDYTLDELDNREYVPHSGEWVAVTNWSGAVGRWNDVPNGGYGNASGYVVEYGDLASGSTGFDGLATTSSAVTVVDVPAAPTGVTAARGAGSATVSFTPGSGNGSPVTGYVVTTSPGGATTPCDGTPCTVTGLTNGTPYTFTVRATNAVGSSPESDPTEPVVPATTPGAPVDVTAAAGNASATVTFTAPDEDGGSEITGYTVTASPGGVNHQCSASPCVIDELTNGTAYTFTVHATNAVGDSVESAASAAVTPVTKPGAPTAVLATAGNGKASVAFTAPADTGGRPITGYTVTSIPDGLQATCTVSPCVVTGLTNGTPYTFTVHATTAVGDSAESEASNAVVPASAPGVPTDVTAARGDRSATITFTVPSSGGSEITGYTVTSDPDTGPSNCAGSPCVVTGLTNGTPYTFTVHATNAVGSSEESDPTKAVTPMGVPDAPNNVTAVRGNGSASVSFTAPSSPIGGAITSYTVTPSPDGEPQVCSDSPCTVTGLTNGESYTFTVRATNDAGSSAESDPSAAVTPATVPGAPVGLTVDRGRSSAGLSFRTPTDNGGAAVSAYEVSTDHGDTWETLVTTDTDPMTATVTGLTNGTAYDVWVRAVNAVGPGIAAESDSVTPAAEPDAPTGVTATRGDRQATVTFTPPAGNGSSITGYTVYGSPGDDAVSCAGSPCVVSGLTNGTAYRFRVVATNGVGSSEPSEWSELTTPAGAPSAPALQTVTSVAGAAAFTFTAPEHDNGAPVSGYEVSTDGGDQWSPLTASGTTPLSAAVSGLTNGTTYAIRVRAVNAAGAGAASASLNVKPATVPSAPRNVKATAVGTRVTVSWTAPASDGGSAITGYLVTAAQGGQTCRTTTTSCVFPQLLADHTHTFSVVAVNTAPRLYGTGTGPAAVSNQLHLSGRPGATRSLVVTPRDRVLALSFLPPAITGGSKITGYRVSLDNGRTWRRLTVHGSTKLRAWVYPVLNGRSYPVVVRAVNANGWGPATPTVTVRTVAWFYDPVPPTGRARQIDVPQNPARYRGPLRETKAAYRSRNGSPAFPATWLGGRKLQAGHAVNLGGGSVFAFDSAVLTKAGQAKVKAMAVSLTYVSGITCEGYADYGGRATHEMALSKQRAAAVCASLKKHAPQVTSRQTAAYGRSRPVVVGGAASQRASNRRVVVLIRS